MVVKALVTVSPNFAAPQANAAAPQAASQSPNLASTGGYWTGGGGDQGAQTWVPVWNVIAANGGGGGLGSGMQSGGANVNTPGLTAADIRELLNRPFLPLIMGGEGTTSHRLRTLSPTELRGRGFTVPGIIVRRGRSFALKVYAGRERGKKRDRWLTFTTHAEAEAAQRELAAHTLAHAAGIGMFGVRGESVEPTLPTLPVRCQHGRANRRGPGIDVARLVASRMHRHNFTGAPATEGRRLHSQRAVDPQLGTGDRPAGGGRRRATGREDAPERRTGTPGALHRRGRLPPAALRRMARARSCLLSAHGKAVARE